MKKEKYILGIGGINMDINIKSLEDLKLHDSNPSHVTYSAGGVVRNILENLSRLEENTIILSSVGCDAFGETVLKASNECGINTDYVYHNMNERTSCYISLMGPDGDMFIGASDMDILEHTPWGYYENNKELISNASVVVMDTNPSIKLMDKLFKLTKGKKVFIDPVSCSKVKKIKPFLKDVFMIKPNVYELEELTGISCHDFNKENIEKACNLLHQEGVNEVVVSMGDKGCYYSNIEGIKLCKKFKPCQMVNATGAGDSFLAGYIKGYVNNMSIEERLDYALACGIICVNSKDTISKEMSLGKIKETIIAYKGE